MSLSLSEAGSRNSFNGVELGPAGLPQDPQLFHLDLGAALTDWEAEGLVLAWLRIGREQAELIPQAVSHGFDFHHAQPDYVLLTRPLVPDPLIPPYATHYIGVGGMVLDDDDRLLVVSETYRLDLTQPFWKLPGGLLDPGEHLEDGVRREVWEETAIQTDLLHLVGMWHGHQYFFGKSGIYIVFRLRPQNLDIQKDDNEIEECEWMPVAEFLSHPNASSFNRSIVRAGLYDPTLRATAMPYYPRPEMHEFFFPPRHAQPQVTGRP